MNARLRWILALSIVAPVIWLNVTQLIEAFGPGPPYYSRTTNMDKWDNPVPLLLAVDSVVLGVVAVLMRWRRGTSP